MALEDQDLDNQDDDVAVRCRGSCALAGRTIMMIVM